ncbi:hypothetical protein FO441_00975 [Salinicoccus cyprini]|uniref:Asparagine synthetase domain-containing protein n=1 Tax=Salinicoccus cyprini TaxID=2493691 RepID=A0A558AXA1_9STAP|nr:hypothetical protein [Salinicoccus cyprini]TVT28884.1 hypothetical protein FO441_00975 [Salinicoccus cyprini]
MELDRKTYKAFVISSQIQQLNGFGKYKFGKVNFFVSSDYNYHMVQKDNITIFLLGYCFDINDSNIFDYKVIENMTELDGKNDWYDYMNYLNGRYIIIIFTSNELLIYPDATSMKPIFYNKTHKIVSSHEYIIKEALSQHYNEKIETSSYVRKNAMDWTDTEGIYKLNPSIELEYHAFKMKRIFPRTNKSIKPVADVVQTMQPYLEETIKWLSLQPNKKVSITGGVDSRISLAILKPLVYDMEFFTYIKQQKSIKSESMLNAYQKDREITSNIAHNLNLKHKEYIIPTNDEIEQLHYIRTFKETMSSQHSYQLSYLLNRTSEFDGALHIKSTVQSIGKSSFPTKLYSANNMENLLSGIKKWVPEEFKKKQNYSKYFDEISDYLKRVDLNQNTSKNYHLLDLVFLESRLGNFQSNITQETDNTMEVFNLFNSRKLIELLLSVPLEDRQNQSVGKYLISSYWPVLNYFPLNSAPGLEEKYYLLKRGGSNQVGKKMFDHYKVLPADSKGVKIYQENNMYVIEPEELPLDPNKTYKIKLINFSVKKVSISINSMYENEKGRGNVSVEIDKVERDVLDFFNSRQYDLPSEEYFDIEIKVHTRKEKASWIKAARLYLDFNN